VRMILGPMNQNEICQKLELKPESPNNELAFFACG